jgi:hypothetical protein
MTAWACYPRPVGPGREASAATQLLLAGQCVGWHATATRAPAANHVDRGSDANRWTCARARVTPSEVLGGVPHRTSLVSAGRQVRKDDIGQHL